MMDPQVVREVSNSKLGNTIAKQLWPSMLFLVVMSLISLFGSKWILSGLDSPTTILVSFWIWFASMIIITGFGIYVLILDARIQFASSNIE